MLGLERDALSQIDYGFSIKRIRSDSSTDFVLAPHFGAVYEFVADELWERVRQLLSDGGFAPGLPVTIEAPKPCGTTRPGSILPPADRLVYQMLVDRVAPIADQQLDRNRVFSQVLLDSDPEGRMFEEPHLGWQRFQEAIQGLCENPHYRFAIRGDIANFFERASQHDIVNLLRACECPPSAVNLLEKLLTFWREKSSRGILQGMYASDFLGNFSLCSFDAFLDVREIPSVRYVDDIYAFFSDMDDAKRSLAEMCRALRKESLDFNESKTRIMDTESLFHEETRFDKMFKEARDELDSGGRDSDIYGFLTSWLSDEDGLSEEEKDVCQIENLYSQIDDASAPSDRIERFCLPALAAAGSDIATDRAIRGLTERPHLAQTYASYLVRIGRTDRNVAEELENLFQTVDFPYDWQYHWLAGALMYLQGVSRRTVTRALKLLRHSAAPPPVRAVCAILVGRHGDAARRRQLKNLYVEEGSAYVRSAIIYASRYFPTSERRTCIGVWSGHSLTNNLVAQAVRQLRRA